MTEPEYPQVDGDDCECCVRGTFSTPYDEDECLGCHHPEGLHGEYDGPWGSPHEWTS